MAACLWKGSRKYYRLRIREDTRTQVAIEESNLFGAVFGKTEIEKGYDIEEKYVKKWEKEAIEETKIKAAKTLLLVQVLLMLKPFGWV